MSRGLADRLLSALAVVGALTLLLCVGGPAVGVHTYVVRSASMSPTIGTGAVVVAHRVPVNRLSRGDVVSVPTPEGSRVTHRLVRLTASGLVLRGDANQAVDPAPYAVDAADRVVLHVPLLGYAVAVAASPLGLLGLVLLVVGCAVAAARPRRPSPIVVAVGVVLVAALAVIGPGVSHPSWAAAWTDAATIDGGSYAATTIAAPTVSCSTLGVLSTKLTWTAVSGATGYVLHYGTGGATTETVASGVTSKTFTSVQSGTFWVETQRAFGSTTWTSAISNKKAYTVVLTLVGTCVDG